MKNLIITLVLCTLILVTSAVAEVQSAVKITGRVAHENAPALFERGVLSVHGQREAFRSSLANLRENKLKFEESRTSFVARRCVEQNTEECRMHAESIRNHLFGWITLVSQRLGYASAVLEEMVQKDAVNREELDVLRDKLAGLNSEIVYYQAQIQNADAVGLVKISKELNNLFFKTHGIKNVLREINQYEARYALEKVVGRVEAFSQKLGGIIDRFEERRDVANDVMDKLESLNLELKGILPEMKIAAEHGEREAIQHYLKDVVKISREVKEQLEFIGGKRAVAEEFGHNPQSSEVKTN